MYELKAKHLQVNLFQELKGWANRNIVNQNLIVYGEWYKGDDRLPKGFWFWSSAIFFFNGLRVSFVNVTYSLEPLKRLGRLLPGLPGLLRLENFTFFRKLQPPDEHGERRSRVTSLSETGMEEAWNRRQARIQSQSSCLSIWKYNQWAINNRDTFNSHEFCNKSHILTC